MDKLKYTEGFNRVARSLERHLEILSKNDIELFKGYQYLSECYTKRACPHIDYDIFGNSFLHSFFLENYWKTAYSILNNPLLIGKNILDIGSGAGSSALAYLTWLDVHVGNNKWKVKITFLDRSKGQLKLAREIITRCNFRNLKIFPKYVLVDVNQWENYKTKYDVILLGHVLNENISSIEQIIKKANDLILPNGKILIIERPHDEATWQGISKANSKQIVNNLSTGIQLSIDGLAIGKSPHFDKKHRIETQYLSFQAPAQKKFQDVLRLYFKAWENKNTPLLEEVFTENAIYIEKPFCEPYVGINEIKNYWLEKVIPQKNISIEIGTVIFNGSNAIVSWQTDFDIMDNKIKIVRGFILFEFDNRTNKIKKLEEVFRTKSAYVMEKFNQNNSVILNNESTIISE